MGARVVRVDARGGEEAHVHLQSIVFCDAPGVRTGLHAGPCDEETRDACVVCARQHLWSVPGERAVRQVRADVCELEAHEPTRASLFVAPAPIVRCARGPPTPAHPTPTLAAAPAVRVLTWSRPRANATVTYSSVAFLRRKRWRRCSSAIGLCQRARSAVFNSRISRSNPLMQSTVAGARVERASP